MTLSLKHAFEHATFEIKFSPHGPVYLFRLILLQAEKGLSCTLEVHLHSSNLAHQCTLGVTFEKYTLHVNPTPED